MALLVIECPHCKTPRSPLASAAVIRRSGNEHLATGLFICPVCVRPVGAWLHRKTAVTGAYKPAELQNWSETIEAGGWHVVELWPAPRESAAPADVPPTIARNFVQAEEAAARTHREAAGMAYRRALELTLKDKAPDLRGTLEKRIDKLAADGRLTSDIADWAHSIRDLGNEATHDEDEPAEEDVADLAAFTRVVLEYIYTMPAKVARRSSATETGEGG